MYNNVRISQHAHITEGGRAAPLPVTTMKDNQNTSNQSVRECDVFISYRRDGGDMTAMYFYQALKERGYNVFYDLEVLRAGKFNEALLSSIQSCKDFVLILSPGALDRCNEENDWVRKEIAEALRSKKNIVPIMLKGFTFPEQLPPDIDDVRYQNGLTCTTEYFEESINRLCGRYLSAKPVAQEKKKLPMLPIAIAVAVVLAVVGFLALRGGRKPEPAPAPTLEATVEPTAEPTVEPTPESTVAPTEAPTPEPTVEPAPQVVKDTDFPVLSHLIDESNAPYDDDDDASHLVRREGPVLGREDLRRMDIASVTFQSSLEGAPEDAWDVSEAGDGRVLAWTTPNGELFDLTIAGDGGVKIVDIDGEPHLFSDYCNVESIAFNGCVDLSQRRNFDRMFWNCYSLKQIDFTGVCTENVTNMSGTFGMCRSLETADLSAWNTASVEYMGGMFLGCTCLKTIDVSGFNTGSVVSMESMFNGCESLESLDVSAFDTSHVTEMYAMFSFCHNLKTLDLSSFDTGHVTQMWEMFAQCNSLTELNVSSFDTSRVTDMKYMFEFCSSLKTLDVSGFDTSRVTDMQRMFAECKNLETLDVSGFDTARVTSLHDMFVNCKGLKSLDVGGFNTEKVTDISGMFCDCEGLETLDLKNWNTGSIEDMHNVFWNCRLLDNIDVSAWNTSKVTTMENMFTDCILLYRLDLSDWDTSHVVNMDHMFTNCNYATELLVTNWDVSAVETMVEMFYGNSSLQSIGRDPATFGHGDTTNMYDGCEKLEGV